MPKLKELLPRLSGKAVRVLQDTPYTDEPGFTPVHLAFSDGSRLIAGYWRLIGDGHAKLSSFDHEQKYGLPAPIDAKRELRDALENRTCVEAILDTRTGDLALAFDGGTRFQVFNFTGYEVWELTFPGIGTAYSTYAIES